MAGKFSEWFKGESESINIGILPSPTKEKSDPLNSVGASSEIKPTPLLPRKPTSINISKPAIASRLSFFSSKASLAKPAKKPNDLNDDFIEMDISAALSPIQGPDPFSPAAMKHLQSQAESLLLRLQIAYKERTVLLCDTIAEKETLAEETEGAETRARQLRTQLDDMSIKLAQQDEAMMSLVDELAQEKLARREEEEARKRSVRLVEHAASPITNSGRPSLENPVSDSGFESEDESSAESVFSTNDGTRSPTLSMSSVSTNNSPEAYHMHDCQAPLPIPQAARLRRFPSQAVKGTFALHCNDTAQELTRSSWMNRNSNQASEAWGIANLLKEENKCLKHRVGELESALDGCLDLVGNLGR